MNFTYNVTYAREAGYVVRNVNHTAYLSDDAIARTTADAGAVLGYMSGLKATPTMKMAADKTITAKLNTLNKFLTKLVNDQHRADEKRFRLVTIAGSAILGHVDVKFTTIDDVKKTMTFWNIELATPGNSSFPEQYAKINRNRGMHKSVVISQIFNL